ncbi:MAG: 30S ribosomal protein THX [Chitinophagales bacterium]
MGKGDIRSKKGKIARGSFGNIRPKKKTKVYQPKEAKPETTVEAEEEKES